MIISTLHFLEFKIVNAVSSDRGSTDDLEIAVDERSCVPVPVKSGKTTTIKNKFLVESYVNIKSPLTI